jgi:hypothetical protein
MEEFEMMLGICDVVGVVHTCRNLMKKSRADRNPPWFDYDPT